MPTVDPLSEVLSLLSARSVLSASLRLGGEWSIRFPSEGVKFNAVMRGRCFLLQEGSDEVVTVDAGDCFLLTNCGSYVLCSDPLLTPVDARGIFSEGTDGSMRHEGDRDDFLAIGGRITLDDADAALLLDALPRVFRVAGASPEAPVIRWLLTRLVDEWTSMRPGGALAADHLAQLLFVEVIRAWLQSSSGPTAGWLHAMGDRRVGAAMRLLHGEPARRWRLQDLAEAAGMSRSNFALRFRQLAGVAPLDYLLRWRMRLAAKALRTGGETISSIAYSLGYQSESAFSNAFRRVMGVAPQQYRRDRSRADGLRAAAIT
jgi:AraC-like DNA-binding protein